MMRPFSDARHPLRTAQIAADFADWLREDGDRLVAAADLLGGPKWAACAQSVVDDVATGAAPSALLPELRALRRLLQLEFVDDLFSAEAAFFAAIHPDDPRADAARVCAAALDGGVAALARCDGSGTRSREEAA